MAKRVKRRRLLCPSCNEHFFGTYALMQHMALKHPNILYWSFADSTKHSGSWMPNDGGRWRCACGCSGTRFEMELHLEKIPADQLAEHFTLAVLERPVWLSQGLR